MCEVPDRGRRRRDKPFAKIDIETDAAVPVESTFAGAKGTRMAPPSIARRRSGTRLTPSRSVRLSACCCCCSAPCRKPRHRSRCAADRRASRRRFASLPDGWPRYPAQLEMPVPARVADRQRLTFLPGWHALTGAKIYPKRRTIPRSKPFARTSNLFHSLRRPASDAR